jgi:hypothetical protein
MSTDAGERRLLFVAVGAGVGAAWGPIWYYVVFLKLFHKGLLAVLLLVLGTALVTFIAWRFVEPAMARLFGLKQDHGGPSLSSKLFFRAYAGIFATGLVMAPIEKGLVDLPIFWMTSALLVVLGGAITHGWARAAELGRPMWLAGMLNGLGYGALAGVAMVALFMPAQAWSAQPLPFFVGAFLFGAIHLAIWGVLWGAAGGAAIQYLPGLRIWLRALLGLGAGTVFIVLAKELLFAALSIGQDLPIMLSLVFTTLGWSAAIWIYSPAQSALTSRSERATTASGAANAA